MIEEVKEKQPLRDITSEVQNKLNIHQESKKLVKRDGSV